MGLLDPSAQEEKETYKQLAAGLKESQTRTRRILLAKQAIAALAAIIVVGLTIGIVYSNHLRSQAEQARDAQTLAKQQALARVGAEWHDGAAPRLGGAIATIVCARHAVHPGGDHQILVGAVEELHAESLAREPLIYYASAFRALAPG